MGRARRVLARVGGRSRRGTLALLGGGVLLARALRAKGRLRSVLQAGIGLALVAYGVRQRLSGGEAPDGGGRNGSGGHPGDPGSTVEDAGGPTEAIRHESQTGTNPRDVEADPDVETATSPDDGAVRFTTDQDETAGPKPDAGDEVDGDPRREPTAAETEEGGVEVDISEAHVADEPSEAVGPDPEQAYPTQVEDTEPDASPEADSSHVEADEPATDVSESDADGERDTEDDTAQQGEDETGDRQPTGGEQGAEDEPRDEDEQVAEDEQDDA